MEQGPEVDGFPAGAQALQPGGRNGERERALVTGNAATDRGERFEGMGVREDGRQFGWSRDRSGAGRKPGEPYGRLRGATNPQGILRSKPSKSGGTTRTDQSRSGISGTGRPSDGSAEWTQ